MVNNLATGSQGMATRRRRQHTELTGSILRPHPPGNLDIRQREGQDTKLTLPAHRRDSKPTRPVLRRGTKDTPPGLPLATKLRRQQQGKRPSRPNG